MVSRGLLRVFSRPQFRSREDLVQPNKYGNKTLKKKKVKNQQKTLDYYDNMNIHEHKNGVRTPVPLCSRMRGVFLVSQARGSFSFPSISLFKIMTHCSLVLG